MQKKSNKKTGMRTEMEEPMTCNLCDESFSSEHELRDHQQTVHAAGVNSRRSSHESELDDDQETAA